METTVTLDSAGRILIPKEILDELNLEPGDNINLASEGGQVTLRATGPRATIKQGAWVSRAGEPISAVSTAEALLDQRTRHRIDALNAAAGSWKDEDHPEQANGGAAYVDQLRDRDRRLEQERMAQLIASQD